MNNKVIFILIDGLNYEVSNLTMGFMNHLVENKLAAKFKVKTELPALSRPLYETILTGTPCCVNGVFNNLIVRRSHEKSIFELASQKNLVTAAAAYYWISELYNRAPFNYIEDREQENKDANIQYGKFYFQDEYPDTHLFIDGEVLRKKYNPDFLLIHPMGADYVGHSYGCNSKEYRAKAIELDSILGTFVPLWMQEGYNIIVTADHGIDELGLHNGSKEEERKVAMWIISELVNKKEYKEEFDQLMIAPMICEMLNISKSKKMLEFVLSQEEV